MEVSKPQFEKYILVCENHRDVGDCCAPQGVLIREELKKKVKEAGLSHRIRVSRTGCLDVCSQGPNVLLMPDNLWFKRVTEKDLSEIMKTAVSRLNPPQ